LQEKTITQAHANQTQDTLKHRTPYREAKQRTKKRISVASEKKKKMKIQSNNQRCISNAYLCQTNHTKLIYATSSPFHPQPSSSSHHLLPSDATHPQAKPNHEHASHPAALQSAVQESTYPSARVGSVAA
jgi:hypothetical protein